MGIEDELATEDMLPDIAEEIAGAGDGQLQVAVGWGGDGFGVGLTGFGW